MIQFEKAFIINCGVISIRPLYCRNETGTRGGELRGKDVTLTQLAPHVWMHTSTGTADGNPSLRTDCFLRLPKESY